MAAPAEAHDAPHTAGLRLNYDAIVVGAGIMGSCAAHAAVSHGAHTLLLERFDLLHQLGSSHGDSRIIRDSYVKEIYPPMVRLARRLWADAEAQSGYRVLTPAPHVTMGTRGNPALLAAVKSPGAEEVDLSQMWGGAFQAPEGCLAVLNERAGVLHATKAVAMFQALAVKLGAVVRDNTEVVDIRKAPGPEGGVVVSTRTCGEFRGAKCIVTAGAWTSKLLRSVAGVGIPIQPLHTLNLYWRIKPGREHSLTAKAGFPTFSSYDDTRPYVYGTPSLELPGLIKISCDGGPPCDPDNRDWASSDREITERAARWIQDFMPGHVDSADGPVVRQSCMYSMTPDKDFVIDRLGGEFGEDLVVGAGFSGHGFKMGPAVGRILAEMALHGVSTTAALAGVELGQFKINRFNANKYN